MEPSFITIQELSLLYPDEWVLLGNPRMENTTVLGGVLAYHSKDKKEVCYLGRDKAEDFDRVTIAYTGNLNQKRKVGILRGL